jgi:LmbE family N-acetylglucosaminyl deacetylase
MGVEIASNAAGGLGGRVLVVSPHLDDAALSLGAAIRGAVRRGAAARVLTVLAGDPGWAVPATDWDVRCGFTDAGEAVRVRREEDRVALGRLGAAMTWLPFGDHKYERGGTDDEVWDAVARECAWADVVLVPGFPLVHPDHLWLTVLLLARGLPCARVGLYVEQPYAYNRRRALRPSVLEPLLPAAGPSLQWLHLGATVSDRAVKWHAIRAYGTQLRELGLSLHRGRLERILLYEQLTGGEMIAWLPTPEPGASGG